MPDTERLLACIQRGVDVTDEGIIAAYVGEMIWKEIDETGVSLLEHKIPKTPGETGLYVWEGTVDDEVGWDGCWRPASIHDLASFSIHIPPSPQLVLPFADQEFERRAIELQIEHLQGKLALLQRQMQEAE